MMKSSIVLVEALILFGILFAFSPALAIPINKDSSNVELDDSSLKLNRFESDIVSSIAELCQNLKNEWESLETSLKEICFVTYLNQKNEYMSQNGMKKRFFSLEVGKQVNPSNGGGSRSSSNVFKYGRK